VPRSREAVLDRLKKLYAKAKSAEAIGSEEEAKAFAAKVQELLSLHKIDLSEVEYQNLDETDPVIKRLVDFGSAGIKVKKRRVEWQESMADIVCLAYFCKFIVFTGSSNLYFVGRGVDLEAAEQVFLYLLRVANSLADKEYVKFFYECRDAGDVTMARGFRSAYLVGFTQRLSERYNEERERIKNQHAASGTALIRLTDAIKAVENFIEKAADTKRAPNIGATTREENEEGYKRGRRDAEAIPIGQNQKQVE
jgi:Protein of unknown function (DUF2786)